MLPYHENVAICLGIVAISLACCHVERLLPYCENVGDIQCKNVVRLLPYRENVAMS